MYTGPHWTLYYDVAALTDLGVRPFLLMEQLIPGITTWSHTGGSGPGAMKALRNRLPKSATPGFDDGFGDQGADLGAIQKLWQTVPAHAAYLLQSLPAEIKATERYIVARTDKTAGFTWLPKITDELETSEAVKAGAGRIQDLVARGVLSSEHASRILARWYQVGLSSWSMGRSALVLRADGGTGKSVGSFVDCLALAIVYRLYRILILCPAEVRDPYVGWPMEVKTFSNVTPYVMLPEKSPLRRKARWQTAAEYLADPSGGQQIAIAICAYNDIGDYLEEIAAFAPTFIIIDEVDKVGKNSKRFDKVLTPEGTMKFEQKRTEKKKRVNRAAGIAEVVQLKSVRFRLPMSATAVDTGDPEHIYGILDLADPGGWGSKYCFLSRYKSGPPLDDAKYPQYAERSPSNLSELRRRMKALYLDIPASITKRFVPACNVVIVRIPVEDQGSTRGFGLNALVKQAMKNGDRQEGFELELAAAAMAKKPYVVRKAVAALRSGLRVVVYANRIEVVEHLYEAILKGFGVKWEEEAMTPIDVFAGLDGEEEEPEAPFDIPEESAELSFENGAVASPLCGSVTASLDKRALAAAHLGLWAARIHSGSDAHRGVSQSNRGRLIAEYANLSLEKNDGSRQPALIVGSRDSIGRGINGLQETDLALYVQLGASPGPLLQAIYRHERPKRRMGFVATEFQILIAEGTVDARVEDETLRLGQSAAAVAPTEGLVGVLTALKEAAMVDVDQLAARFNQDGEEARQDHEYDAASSSGYHGAADAGAYEIDDDEEVPF